MTSTDTEVRTTLPAATDAEIAAIDAWWRADNYLTIGQIYLQDNVLLTEPLRPEHIKPRLLGHWGTSPDSRSSTRTRRGSSSTPASR